MRATEWGRAWRVEDEHGNHGIVVQEDYELPYWWVLCPAAATLVLDPPTEAEDLRGGNCSDRECLFDEVHVAANVLIRRRSMT